MGNRTPVLSLEGFSSAIELLPHKGGPLSIHHRVSGEENAMVAAGRGP